MPRANRLSTLIARSVSRREFINMSAAIAAAVVVPRAYSAIAAGTKQPTPSFTFKSVPPLLEDTVTVAEGYTATPFFLHGDPVSDGVGWKFAAGNSAEEAMQQCGQMLSLI
ncbi:MAG: hypothetical protein ABL931_19625, partial [Usitatibacteraceae bacterium]